MSSTARGTRFEDRVFDAIVAELRANRLGLSPDHCLPFKRRSYYSRDRDDQIVVDVSIEVWIPGTDSWSILWVCECKDYGHSVPVDDIEEFKAKLDQIAGSNVKGFLATTTALQRAALAYARSNGIGVIRLLPDGQVRYILALEAPISQSERQRIEQVENESALTEPGFVSVNRGALFGEWRTRVLRGWHDVLSSTLISFDNDAPEIEG